MTDFDEDVNIETLSTSTDEEDSLIRSPASPLSRKSAVQSQKKNVEAAAQLLRTTPTERPTIMSLVQAKKQKIKVSKCKLPVVTREAEEIAEILPLISEESFSGAVFARRNAARKAEDYESVLNAPSMRDRKLYNLDKRFSGEALFHFVHHIFNTSNQTLAMLQHNFREILPSACQEESEYSTKLKRLVLLLTHLDTLTSYFNSDCLNWTIEEAQLQFNHLQANYSSILDEDEKEKQFTVYLALKHVSKNLAYISGTLSEARMSISAELALLQHGLACRGAFENHTSMHGGPLAIDFNVAERMAYGVQCRKINDLITNEFQGDVSDFALSLANHQSHVQSFETVLSKRFGKDIRLHAVEEVAKNKMFHRNASEKEKDEQIQTELSTAFMWQPRIHALLLDMCIALLSASLPAPYSVMPPYVLLEIFDWFPGMFEIKRFIKIRLIEGIVKSFRNVKNANKSVKKSK